MFNYPSLIKQLIGRTVFMQALKHISICRYEYIHIERHSTFFYTTFRNRFEKLKIYMKTSPRKCCLTLQTLTTSNTKHIFSFQKAFCKKSSAFLFLVLKTSPDNSTLLADVWFFINIFLTIIQVLMFVENLTPFRNSLQRWENWNGYTETEIKMYEFR